MSYARRAVALLKRGDQGRVDSDYAVTDIQLLPGTAGRKRCVVYVQQRFMGLPVYDGRRSVIFTGRLVEVTGKRVPVRSLPQLAPAATAESALQSAFRRVFGRPCPEIERLCGFATAERFQAFRAEGLSLAKTHVAVFAGRRTHLAWVVDFVEAGGPRYEIVLDALTLGLLRKRLISQSDDACITLPSSEPAGARILFEPAWRTSGAVSVKFKNRDWAPPAAVAGAICGTETRDRHSLNAFSLSNRALDLYSRFLTLPGPPIANLELFTELVENGANAAFADGRRVVLKGVTAPPRHAALDPSVVIHEVSHVVLDAAVGGSAFPHPFETEGESSAVSEGLADFFGLTVWNSICRSMSPTRETRDVFGPTFVAGGGRDYSPYFDGDGPPMGSSTEPHELGMALCGALVQGRAGLIDNRDLSEEEADEVLWMAVCRGLPLLPHQDLLPNFCCVRRVVRDNLPALLRSVVEEAFEDIGIPVSCPHIT